MIKKTLDTNFIFKTYLKILKIVKNIFNFKTNFYSTKHNKIVFQQYSQKKILKLFLKIVINKP